MDITTIAAAWGNEIRRRRQELDLTRKEFAARAGVSRAMVGYWETGTNVPSPRMQAVLIGQLGIDYGAVVKAITADGEVAS